MDDPYRSHRPARASPGTWQAEFKRPIKLDHHDLKRKDGELFIEYVERLIHSDLWKSQNCTFYDLSVPGAEKLRDFAETYPDTYYFSHYGNATFKSLRTGHYLPEATISPLLTFLSYRIGKHTDYNLPQGEKEWWPNDGVVNTISGSHPFDQPYKEVTKFDLNYEPGLWNVFPVKHGYDHIDFVIQKKLLHDKEDLMLFYRDLVDVILNTEKAPQRKAEENKQEKKEELLFQEEIQPEQKAPKKASPKSVKATAKTKAATKKKVA